MAQFPMGAPVSFQPPRSRRIPTPAEMMAAAVRTGQIKGLQPSEGRALAKSAPATPAAEQDGGWLAREKEFFNQGREGSETVDRLTGLLMSEAERGVNEREEEPPTFTGLQSPEDIQKTYKTMGGRNKLATLFAMSGARPLQNAAEMLRGDPEEYMRRQNASEVTRQYQNWQASNAAKNREDNKITRLSQAVQAAGRANAGTAYGAMKKMGSTERKDMAGRKKMLDVVGRYRTVMQERGPEFVQQSAQAVQQATGIDFMGGSFKAIEGLGKWANDRGFMDAQTPQVRESIRFWADVNANLIAPWRHDTFGATLTVNENAAFEAMLNLSNTMDPNDVLKRFDDIYATAVDETRNFGTLHAATFGPGILEVYGHMYGGHLDGPTRRSFEGPAGAPMQPEYESGGELPYEEVEY